MGFSPDAFRGTEGQLSRPRRRLLGPRSSGMRVDRGTSSASWACGMNPAWEWPGVVETGTSLGSWAKEPARRPWKGQACG
eukprot:11464098-Alexandrium_andersonii.AAC.1